MRKMARNNRWTLLGVVVVLLAAAAVLCGCRAPQVGIISTPGLVEAKLRVEDLNRTANDSALLREERARAVFRLWRYYIRPGMTAEDLGSIFTNTTWIEEADVEGCFIGNPLLGSGYEYLVRLFPDNDGWSEWTITFTLSDSKGVNQACDFLLGNSEKTRGKILVEFALWNIFVGIIEIFNCRGLEVRPERLYMTAEQDKAARETKIVVLKDVCTHTATVNSNNILIQERIIGVMEKEGIVDYYMEGSKTYRVFVLKSKKRSAIEALKRDAAEKKYHIQFVNAKEEPAND